MVPNETAAQGASQEQDEIDEIMKEIKNLQESINSVQTQKPAAPKLRAVDTPAPPAAEEDVDMSDFQAAGSGEASASSDAPSLEETMATLKGDPDAKTLFDEDPEESVDAAPSSMSKADEELADAIEDLTDEASASAEEGSLTMTLSGKMSLKLKYAFDGNEVSVRFQDECLIVSLTDGTEMKIPLRRRGRRAA